MPEADCLFCRIAHGEIPSKVLYQDGAVTAIRDINPQAPVHVLVFPNRHLDSIASLQAADDALAGKMLRVCADLARQEGVERHGYRVVANAGAAAGQSVPHLHFHLLGGRGMAWPPG